MSIIIANKTGEVDSSYHTLVRHIKCDIPIVMVSWSENFVFNEELLKLKEYVLISFCEYGWNYSIMDSHLWGVNTNKKGYGDGRYSAEGWQKFDEWVKANPPRITFSRELLKKDVSEKVQPIEYPAVINSWPIQTREEFNARPINIFQYWGRSNECRIRIHGEIWNHAFTKGFQPCDNLYYINEYLNNEAGEKWITLWIPHWARVDIGSLMTVNNLSKLSLSWPGAGFKCFRNSEAPVNSVMVMHKNNFSWTRDWNETNCILVEPGKEIEGIESALKNPNLYDIYLEGMKTVDKYRLPNYIAHLENLINNA